MTAVLYFGSLAYANVVQARLHAYYCLNWPDVDLFQQQLLSLLTMAAVQRAAADEELDESPEAVTKEVFKPYQCRCSSIVAKGAVPHAGDIAEASSLRCAAYTSVTEAVVETTCSHAGCAILAGKQFLSRPCCQFAQRSFCSGFRYTNGSFRA